MRRRDFLKLAVLTIGGVMSPLSSQWLGQQALSAGQTKKRTRRWAMLVDTIACTGCGLCVKACKLENDIPYEVAVSRTWVERYTVTRSGETFIDSPNAGRDGFTRAAIDMGEGHKRTFTVDEIEKAFFVPKLCNQCENPPCVQVCPVGATYQTEDGVVLIDRDWCIGCGYCIMSCPYGSRFFHPELKVADKCTFCYHRITQGLQPACVEACPFEARLFTDLHDEKSKVAKFIRTERLGLLKEEYGTKPHVFYRGLSREVR